MKVLMIACGGFGIETAGRSEALFDQELAKIPGVEMDLLIIDGSDSNLRNSTRFDSFTKWLAPKTDGGGKIRGNVAEEYIAFLDSKWHELPEADLYIMSYSTAGASGSVFGPEATRRLLVSKKRVVTLMTVTTQSLVDSRNSLNVIRGLASHAATSGKPVVTYIQNGDETPEPDVNANIAETLEAIVYMTSSTLGKLDTSDLSSFLDYTAHGVSPMLTELQVFTDVKGMREEGQWLTTLSVIPDTTHEQPMVNELLDTRAVGGTITLYFGTRIDRMSKLEDYLVERYEANEARANSHKANTALSNTNGMVY